MARIWSAVNLPGCAITIVFTVSVEPRRAEMDPPTQYLYRNRLAGDVDHVFRSTNPTVPILL